MRKQTKYAGTNQIKSIKPDKPSPIVVDNLTGRFQHLEARLDTNKSICNVTSELWYLDVLLCGQERQTFRPYYGHIYHKIRKLDVSNQPLKRSRLS